jgi:ssDNA-binding replication factor A large subunit
MRTVYTKISDISPNQLSVNIIAIVVEDSFNSIPTRSNGGEDDAVGELLIGDASGCVMLLVTKRHFGALKETSSAVVIKNVLPSIVFGRLRLELNRFSSVCGRHVEGCIPNTANNISLIDYDSLGS